MLQLEPEEDDRQDLPVSPRELQTMFLAADYQARRIVRKLGLDSSLTEDIEQDILITLLERRRYFDPSRGPWTPFALRIASQGAQLVADRLALEQRTFQAAEEPGEEIAVSAKSDEDGPSLLDMLADPSSPTEADFIYRLFLLRAIRRLPPELRIVLGAAIEADGELAEAQRALGLSTSEFYRRLKEVRYRIVALGLAPRRMILDI
jgi:DNA-directed RNA polymerase specialized sigma24 family protein